MCWLCVFFKSLALLNFVLPCFSSTMPVASSVQTPELFKGSLKGYQLKGLQWLVNCYEQVVRDSDDDCFFPLSIDFVFFQSFNFPALSGSKWYTCRRDGPGKDYPGHGILGSFGRGN